MTERRIRALELDLDAWLAFLRTHGQGRDRVLCALPADVQCVGMYQHPAYPHRLVVWCESAEFEPVPVGGLPPRWDLTLTTLHEEPGPNIWRFTV